MGDLLLVLGLIVVTAIASGVLIPLLAVRDRERPDADHLLDELTAR